MKKRGHLINDKLVELKKQIESRIKCDDVEIFYLDFRCRYKFRIRTILGTFGIGVDEYDVATKTMDELMNMVVDQFAEIVTRELFRL